MIFEPRSHMWVRPDFNGDEFNPRDHLNYRPSGVHFAGSILGNGPTYLTCNSLTTTDPNTGLFGDNGRYSFSFWAQNLMQSYNNGCTLFVHDPGTFDMSHHLIPGGYSPSVQTTGNRTSSSFQFGMTDFSGNDGLNLAIWPITPSLFPIADSNWHHYLGSVFVNRTHGSKVAALYIDDVLVNAQNLGDVGGAVLPAISGHSFYFGDDFINIPQLPPLLGFGPDVNISEVWIAPGYSLLDVTLDVNHREIIIPSISVADRRIFTTVLPGNIIIPNDYRIFPPSAILFTSTGTPFGGNLGFGGTFTLTGRLDPVGGPGLSA